MLFLNKKIKKKKFRREKIKLFQIISNEQQQRNDHEFHLISIILDLQINIVYFLLIQFELIGVDHLVMELYKKLFYQYVELDI